MEISKIDSEHIRELTIFLEKVVHIMNMKGCDASCYDNIDKSINVLKNKDIKGMLKIKGKIYEDFRMMYERGEYDASLDSIYNKIDKVLESSSLFG